MALYPGVDPEQAFATEPPNWARDYYNGGWGSQCPMCNAWMENVRPGKDQPVCDCQD